MAEQRRTVRLWILAAEHDTLEARRGTQVVRERSAKPLCVGSIPTRASSLFLYSIHLVVLPLESLFVLIWAKSAKMGGFWAGGRTKSGQKFDRELAATSCRFRMPFGCTCDCTQNNTASRSPATDQPGCGRSNSHLCSVSASQRCTTGSTQEPFLLIAIMV
jgi:hypothetical protein